eukprot:tig00020816_g14208.t1
MLRLAPRVVVDSLVLMQDDLLEKVELDSLASNYLVQRTRNLTLVEQQELELEEHRQANAWLSRPVSAPVSAPAVTRSGSRDGKPVQRTTRVQRTKKRAATREKTPKKGEILSGLSL